MERERYEGPDGTSPANTHSTLSTSSEGSINLEADFLTYLKGFATPDCMHRVSDPLVLFFVVSLFILAFLCPFSRSLLLLLPPPPSPPILPFAGRIWSAVGRGVGTLKLTNLGGPGVD
jgi:hypothetical protein